MHSKDARARGESEQHLYALDAWRETTFFSPREAAALALTEAITLVAASHVPDQVVDDARQHFDDPEFSQLVFAIVTINSWNRLSLTMRPPVGDYESNLTPE